MSDLDIFFPEPRPLTLRGHQLALLPLMMGQTPAFLKAVTPAMALLQNGAFQLAVTQHYDSLRDAMVIATGLAPEAMDGLYPDDFLQVLIAVVEVNLSFFVQRVVPALIKLVALVVQTRPAPVTGDMSSPALSAPDTALAASPD